MNILITNANSRMALCLTRSLVQKGHTVIVADYVPHSLTFFSRYVSDKFLYPSPYSTPEAFLETIKKKVKQYNIDVLLPVHEETFLISKHIDEFRKIANVPSPEYKAILSVHNKDKLYSHLKSLNILTPKTIPLSEIRDYENISDMFVGKVVLKPRQGGGNWAIRILDRNMDYTKEIENYLANNGIDKRRVLIQEWIPVSQKYSHVVVYQNGKMVQDFADCHLRDFPLSGGAGCLRISCDPGKMGEISKKLFDSLNWHGIAEVEYVTHNETGEYYLIEINPRVWGGVNSAISSGLDIGDILVKIANGEEVRPTQYRRGMKTRWFWADARVFPDYFKKCPTKLGTIIEYLQLMTDSTKTDEFYWDDPIPFFIWPAHAIFKMLKNKSIRPVAYDSLSGEWE
jgi:predicted ATP-grasp superfamily ATP-dependent carboligase